MFNFLKKILILCVFFLLSNCSSPGTALLGPVFTGAKTGSIYQASISYGSSKVVNIVKDAAEDGIKKIEKNMNLLKNHKDNLLDYSKVEIKKLASHTTYAVKISEIEEPEPLP